MSEQLVVIVDSSGPVWVLTLNRPEARNAVDRQMAVELDSALTAFEEDPQSRVAIVTGAGGQFCAGADFRAIANDYRAVHVGERGFAGMARRVREKPVIAAVDGFALGGGFEIALSCDLIVAAENAQFGLPEARRGVLVGGGGLVRLAQTLSRAHALEIALTGNRISAARGYEMGFVNRVVTSESTVVAARRLATDVAQCAPLSVRENRRIVMATLDHGEAAAWETTRESRRVVARSDDAREGLAAFLEKRQPHWSGR